MEEETLTSFVEGQFARDVEGVADGLRRLAARVESAGAPHNGDYLSAATSVIHEITWGVANLNAERLISDAAQIVAAVAAAATAKEK